MKLGIDFGTTNSAVAAVATDGTARIIPLTDDEPVQRSVIYAPPRGAVVYGNDAFRSYLEHDLQGRFVRSLKAFLPFEVARTTLGGRRYGLPELIAAYLDFLLKRVKERVGETPTELVIGRPVRFHADDDADALALRQFRAALEAADLPPVRLVLEPVAAATRYATGLTEPKTLLVGDFGGGTADFAVLRVGPGTEHEPDGGVLGISGVAMAGDALDSAFMESFLMEDFGRGGTYTSPHTTGIQHWNPTVLTDVQRLFYIPLLRNAELARQLERMERWMDDPAPIRRLTKLVFDDLGYPLAWAIEGSKRQLSQSDTTRFRFEEFYHPKLDLEHDITRDELAAAASAMLDAYRVGISTAIERSSVAVDAIDEVFLTGGTSQLPFIRSLFSDLLGADKLREANALTSVCEGLALS